MLYFNARDHLMAERGFQMVRYADDFVILCQNPEDAAAALTAVQEWKAQARLTLHPDKTKLGDARTEGFDSLGYTSKRAIDGRVRRAFRNSRTLSAQRLRAPRGAVWSK